MSIKSHEVVLPEYVAPYAMYGEGSDTDELESAYDQWLDNEISFYNYSSIHLTDVKDGGFMAYHELQDYGIGSCDCATFTFQVETTD